MDKQQARSLIKTTFEKAFDKDLFSRLIKNLLKRIEDDVIPARHGQFIPEAYRQYIKIFERIGKYHDGKNRIDILIIRLQKETSIERARTMQRNFVAGYLQGKYGSSNEKEAALVAFVSPDDIDWRFSLVKMDYKFDENGKVKEEFTPARRWSFLVGINEKSHTAQSRLEKILADDENNPTLAQLEDAFNIETVTKEFFLKYRDLFIRTKEALDKLVENDAKIKADFEAKGVNAVDFAKKLLGQIVFLYFLQKKGWFGVARDADWGAGSKQFLRELFEKKHGDYHNFFNDILEPLFYEALRVGEERKQDDYYYSRFNCKIPFLNGGLFDPIGNYDWVHTDIYLPDVLFSNRKKSDDEGSGILDIFDLYNFTVKEDEPLEKEVAIDPELLGKAYEKFNAIRPDNFEEYKKALKSGKRGDETKFNKQFGVYYTPREIVHYMCQQSLINYLFTELNSGTTSYEKLGDSNLDMLGNEAKKGQLDITIEHKNPEISKEDIETLIHLGEQVGENEARVEREGKETKTYSYQLPESIRNNAELIDRKLANITVCDPAVGSGAFPVGMMSEIVKARKVLSIYHNSGLNSGLKPAVVESVPAKPAVVEDVLAMPIVVYDAANEHSTYKLKRHCIEHSLYGVDIDPGAVEIAKLRLWLSLMVDEEDFQQGASAPCHIKPLPNLDYKIVCGNSLLGVEKNLFNHQFFSDLEKLKPLYFNETNPTRKQDYKKQIDDLISRITNGHKEFDFEIYFSEVFHKKTVEKNWKAYHITWVTHGSRISERMVEFGAKTSDAIVLDEKSRLIISDVLAKKIKEDEYRVLALNVLSDHVHCVLVAEDHEISAIVQNLKGASSFEHNRQLQLSVQGEGRQTKLWAKGSSQTLLESEEHLLNAIEYVQNNHIKHEVSEMGSSTHNRQLKQSVVGVDQAFAPITHLGGFDVVIANPPYVRQESIRHLKPDLAKTFGNFFCGTADIYTYFYKRGIDLLKSSGHLCFIAPNKFMRAGYGKNTRVLLTTQVTPKLLIDFGDLPIFDATTYPSIILVEKRRPDSQDKAAAATFMEADQLERLEETLNRIGFPMPVASLKKEGWNLERPEVLALMEKLRKAGMPLGEYVQGRFYYGIKTGFNEAFVIDENTRLKLIAEDPTSAELIKPWLRGRDIRKWKAEWAGLYLINIASSANRQWPWSDTRKEAEALRLFEQTYPAIYRHLVQRKKQLQKRDDQGKYWWELRSCAYCADFERHKIIYPDITQSPKFTWDESNAFLGNTAYIIPTDEVWLVGLLNSKLIWWYYRNISSTIRGGFVRFIAQYMETIPISSATDAQKAPIIEHTRAILADPDSPTVPQLEAEINQLVYALYHLAEDEIKIVEAKDNYNELKSRESEMRSK